MNFCEYNNQDPEEKGNKVNLRDTAYRSLRNVSQLSLQKTSQKNRIKETLLSKGLRKAMKMSLRIIIQKKSI